MTLRLTVEKKKSILQSFVTFCNISGRKYMWQIHLHLSQIYLELGQEEVTG